MPPRTRHASVFTTYPATPAPPLICPTCDRPLQYDKTVLGGAEKPERWDHYLCRICKATFVYRHRTRKLTVAP